MATLGNTIVKGMFKVVGRFVIKGKMTIDEIESDLIGNADTATKLKDERTIELTGDVMGSTTTDLGGTVTIKTKVGDSSHKHNADDITEGTLPIDRGGTGAVTEEDVIKNLGITATADELNHVKGVTSSIQDQLDDRVVKVEGEGLSPERYTKPEKDKLAAIDQEVATTSNTQFNKVGIKTYPNQADLDINGDVKIRNSNSFNFGGTGLETFELRFNDKTRSLDINYKSEADVLREMGLIGLWKLDGDTKDYSGNGNNGKIVMPNIFDYISWSNHGELSVQNKGYIDDWTNNSFTIRTEGTAVVRTNTGVEDYHMISVKPDTTYILRYDTKFIELDRSYFVNIFNSSVLDGPVIHSPTFETDGEIITTFKTPSDCEAVSIVFGIYIGNGGSASMSYSNIRLEEEEPSSNDHIISDGLGQLCYNFRYDDKDSISLGSLSNILNTIRDGFAINVWFNSGDVTKPQNIIFKDESFYIRIKDSVVQCAIHGPSGWNIAMNETMVLKSNRWYNVTLICDDSMMKTFINGYYTYKGNISPIEINDEIAYVGYSPTESGIGSFPFNGKIQDIRIHNKNISEDEIVKMYKYGANPFYDQI